MSWAICVALSKTPSNRSFDSQRLLTGVASRPWSSRSTSPAKRLPNRVIIASTLSPASEVSTKAHERIEQCFRAAEPDGSRTSPRRKSLRRARAGQISKRGGQSDRCARLFQPAVPISQHPALPASDLRRIWSRAHVLGHGYHAHAVLLATVRD